LGELGDADAVEPLTALIEPEDKPIGRLVAAVVRALGDLGDERAIPALIDVMTAERFNLPAARAAVKALGRIGGDEVVAALRAVQQGHWSDNTRGAGFVARDAKEALAGQPVGAVDTGSS
jgi:HEAT repeat protein